MEPWLLVTVVLVAVLVGATLPVLFQAHQMLRDSRRAMRVLQTRADATLRQVEAVAGRVDRMGAAIEPHVGEVADTLTSVASLAKPLREVHENLVTLATLTGALAPAARAAYRAFHDASDAAGEEDTRGAEREGAADAASSEHRSRRPPVTAADRAV